MPHTPRGTIDFETRSACSLKNCGSWRYSLDPSTEVLCMAFRLPHWAPGQTGLWYPAHANIGVPECFAWAEMTDLYQWILAGGLVEAHNAWFERGIWVNQMMPKFGFPAIPWSSWRCSAAKAATHALPRNLEDTAVILALDEQKDAAGHKLMKKLTKPRRARKAEIQVAADEGRALDILYFETREMFDRLCDYCRQDVLTEDAVTQALPDLNATETAVYLLDQQMNERGFRLDAQAIDTALFLIDQETTRMNGELAHVTNGYVAKATARVDLLTWLQSEGVSLPNTQKLTITEAFENWRGGSDKAKRALEILQELGRSSTAKYVAMKNWRCPDEKAHGGLLYHGASTGRWSGAGVQPQNFPKGKITDMEAVWRLLHTRDIAQIQATYPNVMEIVSHALRGAIIPSEGMQLYVADYASVEARVLSWLASDEEAMTSFRTGADIYCEMASEIYGYPCTKQEHPTERALGKVAVLGCFGPETLVLTARRGWVPLITITSDDYVWDGIEWVCHDGVLDQGPQEVLSWLGIQVTPDHRVWDGSAWSTVASLADSVHSPRLRSALDTAKCSLPATATAPEEALPLFVCSVPAGGASIGCLNRIFGTVARHVASVAHSWLPGPRGNGFGGTPISWRILRIVNACSTALARLNNGASLPRPGGTYTTAGAEFVSGLRGRKAIDGSFFAIWSRFRDGITPIWNWIVRTTAEGTSRGIFGLRRGRLTWGTEEKSRSCSSASSTLKRVYDIANAGPRHRFTIWTSAGPLIVSNCGYQMGWQKFVDTVWTMARIRIDDALSQRTVDAYRAKFWRVKQLWYDTEQAAMAAVETGEPVPCGRVTYQMTEGDSGYQFLYCVLPSGRRLAYPDPYVRPKRMPWGETRLALSFMGIDGYTRQWRRQDTYGGMLVENIDQAVSRDLMAEAMLRCEDSGVYVPILSVHDELLAEARVGTGSVREFEQLMAECPAWATNCPVAAEGWTGLRYRK